MYVSNLQLTSSLFYVTILHAQFICASCGWHYSAMQCTSFTTSIWTRRGKRGSFIKNDHGGLAVKCYPLLSPPEGYTVLFADCEGCLPDFIKTYSDELRQQPLRSIIYERDRSESVDYAPLDKFLRDGNFSCKLTSDKVHVCTT